MGKPKTQKKKGDKKESASLSSTCLILTSAPLTLSPNQATFLLNVKNEGKNRNEDKVKETQDVSLITKKKNKEKESEDINVITKNDKERQNDDSKIVEYYKTIHGSIHLQSILRLLPKQWIDDAIIVLMTRFFQRRSDELNLNCLFLDSYLSRKLFPIEKDKGPWTVNSHSTHFTDNVDAFLAEVFLLHKGFYSRDLVFVPINKRNQHWTLIVIQPKVKKMLYYDSLKYEKGSSGSSNLHMTTLLAFMEHVYNKYQSGNHGEDNQKSENKDVTELSDSDDEQDIVPTTLEECNRGLCRFRDRKLFKYDDDLKENYFSIGKDDSWVCRCAPNTKKQDNSWDCGMFTLLYMDRILHGHTHDFSQKDIEQSRENIITQLIFNESSDHCTGFYATASSSEQISKTNLRRGQNVMSSDCKDLTNDCGDKVSTEDESAAEQPSKLNNTTGTIKINGEEDYSTNYSGDKVSTENESSRLEVRSMNFSLPMLSGLCLSIKDKESPPSTDNYLPYYHPMLNGRDVDKAYIQQRKGNSPSLLELYCDEDMKVNHIPHTLLDATMYIVCYSIYDSSCEPQIYQDDDYMSLHSIYNMQVVHPSLVATKPSLSEANVMELKKDPILCGKINKCTSNNEIVIVVMIHLLQLNLADVESLLSLGRNIIGTSFPKKEIKDIKLLLPEFCESFLNKYNIYLTMVEGQHRMCASSFAWGLFMNSESDNLPVLLKNCSSASFITTVLETTDQFQSDMIEISNQYMESRSIAVPNSLFHQLLKMEHYMLVMHRKAISSGQLETKEYSMVFEIVKQFFDANLQPGKKTMKGIDMSIFKNVTIENYVTSWDSIIEYALQCKTRTNYAGARGKYHKHKNIQGHFVAFILTTVIDIITRTRDHVIHADDVLKGIFYPRSTFAYNFKTRNLLLHGCGDNDVYQILSTAMGYLEHITYLITTSGDYKYSLQLFGCEELPSQKMAYHSIFVILVSHFWTVMAEHGNFIHKFITTLDFNDFDLPIIHPANDMYNDHDNTITLKLKIPALLFLFLVKEFFRTPQGSLQEVIITKDEDTTDGKPLSNSTIDKFKDRIPNFFQHLVQLFQQNEKDGGNWIAGLINQTPKLPKKRRYNRGQLKGSSLDEEDDTIIARLLPYLPETTMSQESGIKPKKNSTSTAATWRGAVSLPPFRSSNEPRRFADEIKFHSQLSHQSRKRKSAGTKDNKGSGKKQKTLEKNNIDAMKTKSNDVDDDDLEFKEDNTDGGIDEDKEDEEVDKSPIQQFIEADYKFNDKIEYKSILDTEQYSSNQDKDGKVFFQNADNIPNYANATLQDVCNYKCPFYITKQDEIKMEDVDVSTLKQEIDKEVKSKTAIPQGYSNKSFQSSRRSYREDTTCSSHIRTILPMFQRSMEAFFRSNDLDYNVSVPSVLRDDGDYPHIQAPHVDFNPSSIRKCEESNDEKPVVVLYAIEEFTIVVYLRRPNVFGATVGTRIKVPKGCAIVMAGNLYHSGDVFFDSENLRLHGYCVPINLTGTSFFQVDATYRDERTDITRVTMQYVSNMGMSYGNDSTMLLKLREIMSLRSYGDVKARKELAVFWYLALYDYIQLSGNYHCTDGSRVTERYWVETMYNHIIDECVKDIHEEGDRLCTWYP